MFTFNEDYEFDDSEDFLISGGLDVTEVTDANGATDVKDTTNTTNATNVRDVEDITNVTNATNTESDELKSISLMDEAQSVGFNARLCAGLIVTFKLVASSRVCRKFLRDLLGTAAMSGILNHARQKNPTAYNKLVSSLVTIQDTIQSDIPEITKYLNDVNHIMSSGWITILYIMMKYPELIVQILTIILEIDDLYGIVLRGMKRNVWLKTALIPKLDAPIKVGKTTFPINGHDILRVVCKLIQIIGKYGIIILGEQARMMIGDKMGIDDWDEAHISDVFTGKLDFSKFNELTQTNPMLVITSVALFFPIDAIIRNFKKRTYSIDMLKTSGGSDEHQSHCTSMNMVVKIGLVLALVVAIVVIIVKVAKSEPAQNISSVDTTQVIN